jgi:hypothetical protein
MLGPRITLCIIIILSFYIGGADISDDFFGRIPSVHQVFAAVCATTPFYNLPSHYQTDSVCSLTKKLFYAKSVVGRAATVSFARHQT